MLPTHFKVVGNIIYPHTGALNQFKAINDCIPHLYGYAPTYFIISLINNLPTLILNVAKTEKPRELAILFPHMTRFKTRDEDGGYIAFRLFALIEVIN